MNLYDRIHLAAADHGDALAFECDDGRVLTHDDLHALVGRISARLLAAGLVPGDRVLVQVGKSVDAVALYLATLRMGGVFVPLNTAYTAAEFEYFVSDAAPRVVVCAPEAFEAVAAAARGVDPAPELLTLGQDGCGSLVDEAEPAAPSSTPRDDDDLAAILYTSGTTGRSKGAMLTHGNLTANATTLRTIWGWQADDVLLHILPVFHAHGLFVALHCALLEPSPILFHRRFDAAAVVATLPRASVLMGVPTHYVRLLQERSLDRDRCAGMRLFISGSAPLRPETFDAFEARTGMRILERYGMTEAGMITSNPLDGARIAGTVGPALPDVELRVVGEDGRVLPAGEVGTVQIRGPNVFAGYWRMPEKTREEFDGDWFVTGDLGTCDGAGRLSIVGRGKDLIISGGLNVYPKEVEAALDALPGVAESAVVGVPHPDLGEAVVAVVVPETGHVPEEAELRRALRDGLAAFKVPRRVLAIDALPRNTMGKVQKNLLRERWAALFADSAAS